MTETVVIAGGGPTGLMLAAELGLAGVRAVLIERYAQPNDYSRSLTLHARTVEVLEQRGLDRFSQFPRVPSYNFGLVELQDYVPDPDLLPLFVPQRAVEQLLEERATELGADIRRGEEVVGFTEDDTGVEVTVRRPGGDEYQVRGAYLVGADGGRSLVRKLAGIGFPGTGSTTDGLTADVYSPPEVQAFVHPTICQAGMYAAIPLSPTQHRVTAFEFGVERDHRGAEPTVAEFQEKWRTCSGADLDLLAIGEVRHLSRVGNATRLAETYRKGRVFLAGDACHIHLPISGQGLNTGVQDALNLGWKLAADLNGWAPEGLLDSYHAERHPVGRQLCWSTSAQDGLLYPLDVVEPLREIFAELVRLPHVTEHIMSVLSGLGLRYTMTAGSQAGPVHPLQGGRAPQAKLAAPDGEITLSGTLHDGHGVLLVLDDRELPEDVVSGRAGRVDVIRASAGPEIDAGVLLVRPDGYVAHAALPGADPQHEDLRLALNTWFGAAAA